MAITSAFSASVYGGPLRRARHDHYLVTSVASPSVFGQPVTLTATVKPSSGTGTPTGTVSFYAGAKSLGSAPLSNTKATLKTTAITVGSQAITAVYSGDSNYAPSTSAVLEPDPVKPDSTTTNVSSSATAPRSYGEDGDVHGHGQGRRAGERDAPRGPSSSTTARQYRPRGPGTLGATGTATFTTSSSSR